MNTQQVYVVSGINPATGRAVACHAEAVSAAAAKTMAQEAGLKFVIVCDPARPEVWSRRVGEGFEASGY